MSESVVEELVAENTYLREKLNRLMSVELSSRITIEKEKPNLVISGVALAEGIWNGTFYHADEVKKINLSGLPLRVEHGRTTDFKDRDVGEVFYNKFDPVLKAIKFKARVTDPEAVKRVLSGELDAVSIKGRFRDYKDYDGVEMGIDFTPIELSLVHSPACKTCMIFDVEELSKRNSNKEDTTTLPDSGSEVDMSEEDTFEIQEGYVLALPTVEANAEYDEEVELELILEEEAKKQKRSYYKYPPGKYPKKIKKRKIIYPYYRYPYYYYYYYPYYGYPNLEEEEKKGPRDDKERFINHFKITEEQFDTLYKILGDKLFDLLPPRGSAELKVIVCPVCEKEFKNMQDFMAHWMKEHKEKYGMFKGKVESKEEEQSDEELRRKRCVFCGELVENLDEHLPTCQAYLDTVELAVKCKFCGKEFKNQKELEKHLKTCKKFQEYYKEKYGEKKLSEEPASEVKEEPTPEQKEEPVEEQPEETPTSEPKTEPQAVPSEPEPQPSSQPVVQPTPQAVPEPSKPEKLDPLQAWKEGKIHAADILIKRFMLEREKEQIE